MSALAVPQPEHLVPRSSSQRPDFRQISAGCIAGRRNSCPPMASISSRMIAPILVATRDPQREQRVVTRPSAGGCNPARTSSRWLTASASAGSSRSVGMKARDQRMAGNLGGGRTGWSDGRISSRLGHSAGAPQLAPGPVAASSTRRARRSAVWLTSPWTTELRRGLLGDVGSDPVRRRPASPPPLPRPAGAPRRRGRRPCPPRAPPEPPGP